MSSESCEGEAAAVTTDSANPTVRQRIDPSPAPPVVATSVESDAGMPTVKRNLMKRVTSDAKLLALLLIYFTVFVDFLGVANLIPVLPFLVGAKYHQDSFTREDMANMEPGIAMSVITVSFNGAQFISSLMFGPLSDRFGRRPLLLASLLGGAVGYGLQGIAIAVGNFNFFICTRILAGLFGGSRPVAIAYIADSSAPEDRAKRIGMLALSITFAMQFGPVLGGSLGSMSLQLPCYAAAGVSAVGTILVWFFVVEVQPVGHAKQNGSVVNRQKTVNLAFQLNTLFSFCCGFQSVSFMFSMALLLPMRFDFNPNQLGLASMGDGIMVLVGNPIYLYLLKRLPVPGVAAIGCVLMALIAICPYMDLLPLFVFRYIAMLGGPIAIPCASAIVSTIAPPDRRGSWTSITVAAQALARALAPLLLGVLFDLDYHVPFLVSSGVVVLGLVACLLMVPMVPVMHAKPAKRPTAEVVVVDAQDRVQDPDSDAISRVDSKSDILSHNAEALVLRLRAEQERMRLRLDKLQEGQLDPQDAPCVDLNHRAQAQTELINWMITLLDTHNYTNWPDHLDGIKLVLFNSFPPLRRSSRADKLTDIIRMLDGHISMAEQSDVFHGVDDFMQALL